MILLISSFLGLAMAGKFDEENAGYEGLNEVSDQELKPLEDCGLGALTRQLSRAEPYRVEDCRGPRLT